jgi:hypothetical protein
MVCKFKSMPDILWLQEAGMSDNACARAYVRQKKVWVNLVGPFVQVRHELWAETVAWVYLQIQAMLVKAKGEEPVVEVTRNEGGSKTKHGALVIDMSEEGEEE